MLIKMKLAVALHLHTYQLFEEFQGYLQFLPPYDLFVTVPDDGARIKTVYPQARIFPHHVNRGMDLGGFFAVLPALYHGNYDYVLKLHSKSRVEWRRALCQAVAGSPEQVEKCLTALSSPTVGMVGAKAWLRRIKPSDRNHHYLNLIRRKFELPEQTTAETFVGGTIFWAKVAPLHQILTLPRIYWLRSHFTAPSDLDWYWYRSFYPDLHHLNEEQIRAHWVDHGQKEHRVPNGLVARERKKTPLCDGMFEHAVERLFAVVMETQGLTTEGL